MAVVVSLYLYSIHFLLTEREKKILDFSYHFLNHVVIDTLFKRLVGML